MPDQINMFGDFLSPLSVDSIVDITDGQYLYIPKFFNAEESDIYFKILYENIDWRQDEMRMYGKIIKFPRLTAWYGDNDKNYSFSGLTLNPKSWTSELLSIKDRIEIKAKCSFNSVLLNLYRNGQDSISWHHDNEKELGENPVIASVNFGETRTFQFRHIKTKEKQEIDLKHGSLLVMMGKMQHNWQHQIPKTKKNIDARINLTFRTIK